MTRLAAILLLLALPATAQQFSTAEAMLGRCTVAAAELRAQLDQMGKLAAYWQDYAGAGNGK